MAAGVRRYLLNSRHAHNGALQVHAENGEGTTLDSECLAYLTKPFPAQSLIGPLKRVSAARS
jgi:hypothetical protein